MTTILLSSVVFALMILVTDIRQDLQMREGGPSMGCFEDMCVAGKTDKD